ncbi:MAG: adenylate/guanylate cyclase domain-containing protein [Dehalococcoidia bacterium]
MEREIRYCTTEDGIRIAYSVEGEGPAIVACPFFVESLSLTHLLAPHEDMMRGLGYRRTLVRFDARGTGLSQRDVDDFSHGGLLRDLDAVIDASKIERFAIFGSGVSGPRAIDYAALHPDRVTALLLYSTFARPADVMSDAATQAFAQLAETNWQAAAQALTDLSGRLDYAGLNVDVSNVIRESADGSVAARLLRQAFATSDVTASLARVRAPTLVMQQRQTQLFTAALGQRIASGIPGARLVLFDVGTSWLGDGAARLVSDAVAAFLGDAPAPGPAPTGDGGRQTGPGLRTVLFTDIVDSTGLTERLGDAAFREQARALDEAMRDAITARGGTTVEGKVLGDGVMAVFSSAVRALEAASDCVDVSERSDLRLHVGVHAGDVTEENGNFYGGVVNVAARICGLCEPGGILVSATVRDLARTSSGVMFEDRGEHALKGIADPVRVFAVRAAE